VIEVSFDPHRLRPADVPALRGDPSKFTAATGWRATIPLEQTLSDSLSYWRKHLQGREKGAGE
jgi:GDP-4-dehydro-6-deoxy-D-mannose reductase